MNCIGPNVAADATTLNFTLPAESVNSKASAAAIDAPSMMIARTSTLPVTMSVEAAAVSIIQGMLVRLFAMNVLHAHRRDERIAVDFDRAHESKSFPDVHQFEELLSKGKIRRSRQITPHDGAILVLH